MLLIQQLDAVPEKDRKLSYDQGFLIGLYLGDGSKYQRKDCISHEVTFSLNKDNIPDIKFIEKAIIDWDIKDTLHVYETKNNVMFVKFYSEKLYNIISEYVLGNYSYEKELAMENI